MGGGMYKDSIRRGMEIRIFGFNPGCANRVTGSGENCRPIQKESTQVLCNEDRTQQSAICNQ